MHVINYLENKISSRMLTSNYSMDRSLSMMWAWINNIFIKQLIINEITKIQSLLEMGFLLLEESCFFILIKNLFSLRLFNRKRLCLGYFVRYFSCDLSTTFHPLMFVIYVYVFIMPPTFCPSIYLYNLHNLYFLTSHLTSIWPVSLELSKPSFFLMYIKYQLSISTDSNYKCPLSFYFPKTCLVYYMLRQWHSQDSSTEAHLSSFKSLLLCCPAFTGVL